MRCYRHRQQAEPTGDAADEGLNELAVACWSEQRTHKDRQIDANAQARFESELRQLNEGLSKKGCTKKRDTVNERIGHLKQCYSRVAQHYRIDCTVDSAATNVIQLQWHFDPKEGNKSTHPRVNQLRTNQIDWDEEQLWRRYTMLSDLEMVFRSLKSELGMRPVYHRK